MRRPVLRGDQLLFLLQVVEAFPARRGLGRETRAPLLVFLVRRFETRAEVFQPGFERGALGGEPVLVGLQLVVVGEERNALAELRVVVCEFARRRPAHAEEDVAATEPRHLDQFVAARDHLRKLREVVRRAGARLLRGGGLYCEEAVRFFVLLQLRGDFRMRLAACGFAPIFFDLRDRLGVRVGRRRGLNSQNSLRLLYAALQGRGIVSEVKEAGDERGEKDGRERGAACEQAREAAALVGGRGLPAF